MDANFSRIVSIIETKHEYQDYRTLSFLGMSGRKEAVHAIFAWISTNPEKAKREIQNVSSALGKCNLYRKHMRLINESLDDLVRSGNPDLVQIADQIDEKRRVM